MNILKYRKAKKLFQKDIAEQLNVDRSTVARWECDKSQPKADKLPKLAEILGCTIDELFDKK